MFTVFVTGSLASGKRSACLHLAQKGFTHIDLDDMAKEFLEDELVQQQLIDAYGEAISDGEGGINKAELARRAFVDAESSKALNGIIWPLVGQRLADMIMGTSCHQKESEEKLVIEIAMLAESQGFTDLADVVLCITASESVRIARALARGMQLKDIQNRIALQASDEVRNALCDVVIDNNGSLESLHTKLDSWLQLQDQEQMF
ncbi:MAG: dephospho-CoA kinase [Coriobacteriia bacterium]|nr:dephospho-CoA kinase [Coriobacteriia bacterium]